MRQRPRAGTNASGERQLGGVLDRLVGLRGRRVAARRVARPRERHERRRLRAVPGASSFTRFARSIAFAASPSSAVARASSICAMTSVRIELRLARREAIDARAGRRRARASRRRGAGTRRPSPALSSHFGRSAARADGVPLEEERRDARERDVDVLRRRPPWRARSRPRTRCPRRP